MKRKAGNTAVVIKSIFTVTTIAMEAVVTPEYLPATTREKTKKCSNSFTGYSQRNFIQMLSRGRTHLKR